MELIDRKTALSLGLTTYFTGKECKYGHISTRKVHSGSCTACSVERTRRWRKDGKQPDFNLSGKGLPSVEYLKEVFTYLGGVLIWNVRPQEHFSSVKGWKTTNKLCAGKVAGHYHKSNHYLEVRLDNRLYKGHRVIYKMLSGEEPVGIVDHIDGDVKNNRFENLRLATSQENARNANKRPRNPTSIYKGVSMVSENRWICYVTVDDTPSTTYFNTELEAALHYDKLALQLFGEFAKLNFPDEPTE
jgi:hypothetical protein